MRSMVSLSAALRLDRPGDLPAAEAAYRAILAARPDDARALHLLGLLCHRTGRPDEALALLRRSVDVAPTVPDFHANCAAVLGDAGRLDDAAAALRQAIALRPDFPEAHYNLGVNLEKQDRLADAAAAFERAAALRPTYA